MNFIQTFITRLALLGAALVVLSCVIGCTSIPSGQEEIDKALPLVANATSWHQFEAMGPGANAETDVICPISYSNATNMGGAKTFRIVTGEKMYSKDGDEPWKFRAQRSYSNPYCYSGPKVDGQAMIISMRMVREMASLEAAEQKQIAGVSCQLYKISARMVSPGMNPDMGSICIDLKTHYPLEFSTHFGATQFSRWNAIAEIKPPEAPDMVDLDAPRQPDASSSSYTSETSPSPAPETPQP
jgi:hypothetical protein